MLTDKDLGHYTQFELVGAAIKAMNPTAGMTSKEIGEHYEEIYQGLLALADGAEKEADRKIQHMSADDLKCHADQACTYCGGHGSIEHKSLVPYGDTWVIMADLEICPCVYSNWITYFVRNELDI